MKDYTFKILRFNPEKDSRAVFKEYTVSMRQGGTVLDGLFYIHKWIDPSLAFRFSCRGSVCGSCAMNINGSFRLACETQVKDLPETVKVRPLSHLPVIRDLIVDMDRFWAHYEKIKPYLVSNSHSGRENVMSRDERKRLDGLVECILCGLCFGACPVTSMNEDYLGPAALLKLERFVKDSRDKYDKRFDIGASGDGVWDCRKAFSCQEVCPKKLSPARAINHNKLQLIKRKLTTKK
jgi:succinate dehydrogenase / fumarate reductase iron-sulfur subunit